MFKQKIQLFVCTFLILVFGISNTFSIKNIDSKINNKQILESKEDIVECLNNHIKNMDIIFTVSVKDFSSKKIPIKNDKNLIFNFVDSIEYSIEKINKNITEIKFKIHYNEAGNLIQHYIHNKALSLDKKTQILNAKCQDILKKVNEKTDYQKIVYFHDYITQTCKYSYSDEVTTAYDVLINKQAISDGYAEAYQLLLTLSNIENQVVYSISNIDLSSIHYFNKVFLDKSWYNVDTSVDTPLIPNLKNGVIFRDYLLVSDSISKQKYNWEYNLYPITTEENNWHMRNKLVVSNQDGLENLTKKAIKEKETYISIRINDYTKKKYNTSFIKTIKSVKKYNVYYIPPASNNPNEEASIVLTIVFNYN